MTDGAILLVEDNPDDVMFTLRAFSKNHIRNEIVVAGDGEDALQRLLPDDGTTPNGASLMDLGW